METGLKFPDFQAQLQRDLQKSRCRLTAGPDIEQPEQLPALILAYIGGSMATVLLLMAYNMNPLYLFNLEMIVVEVLQAVVGSIGILLAVPATAFFASYLYTRKEPDHEH